MNSQRLIKLALALLLVLLLLVGIALAFWLTNQAFQVWEHLQQAPTWFYIAYITGLSLISGLIGWLVWRLLRPERSTINTAETPQPELDESQIVQQIEAAETAGIDTRSVQQELHQLQARREAGKIQVAVFGEISSGKSSLINALLPDARAEVGVIGGTTQQLNHYRWQSPAGDALILIDMPGLNEANGDLDSLAKEEAMRAHIVIYVVDSDLTRAQFEALQLLIALKKPLILAINKADRYSPEQQQMIRQRIEERLVSVENMDIVLVSTGNTQEVIVQLPDGREEVQQRELPPRIDELQQVLQRRIDGDRAILDQLRDSAVFVLIKQKLDEDNARFRRQQADKLVSGYAKKAVIGAIAAVSPGSDLIIQGYLGMKMVVDLARLYDVKIRKVDTDVLLELVQKHVAKTTTLMLAIAGNALKAFPGIGTLAGGVLHAIAYGIIFDTLGRALVTTLETRGELHPVQAAGLFKETLGENLETSAKRFAKLALAEARSQSKSDPQ